MQLAQINIAKWKIDPNSSLGREFVSLIDSVNAAAERMKGFVWRYEDANATDTASAGPFADGTMIVNMSVWQSPTDLGNFVWNTVHKKVYARKAEWFAALQRQHFAMWWVPDGYVPSLNDAKERLDHLNDNGNSDFAFDWSHLEQVKL